MIKNANELQSHDSRFNPLIYKQYNYIPYDFGGHSSCS